MNGDRLATLLTPRSIAVVGATESPGLGRDLLLTLAGSSAAVYPVNPRRDTVLGQRCYPSLTAIPEPVDLAMILLPPDLVPSVVEQCAASGVPSAIICSAGFAETGPRGERLQREITEAARAAGLRLLGPNCIGVLNPTANVAAIAIPPASIPTALRAGNVAVVSQSAGVMISTLELGAQIGIGFRILVSTGNEADVQLAECVDTLIDDSSTDVIGMVLEGVKDGPGFLECALRARAADKPLVALMLGRSVRGRDAVRTHTGTLTPEHRVFDAVCRDSGVAVTTTIAQFVDHLALFSKRQKRSVPGLAVITISGGTRVLVADLAEAFSIKLASLSSDTIAALRSAIPSIGEASNPLDITAAAIEDAEVLTRSLRVLAGDHEVGMIALVLHLKKEGGSEAHRRLVRAFCGGALTSEKQHAVISTIPEGISGYWQAEAGTSPTPFLNDLSSFAAVRSLFDRWEMSEPVEPRKRSSSTLTQPAVIRDALASGRRSLTEAECYGLFAEFDLPIARFELVETPSEAAAAAYRLGYPVVAKLQSDAHMHKRRSGAIRTNLRSSEELELAARDLLDLLPEEEPRRASILVQQVIDADLELLIGVHRDPQFGPALTLGMGGRWAEAIDRTATHLAPVDAEKVPWILSELRLGAPESISQAAMESIAHTVSVLSKLGAQMSPWIASLEVNPLMVTDDGGVVVDALAELSVYDEATVSNNTGPLEGH